MKRQLHLDRRADELVRAATDAQEMFSTPELAKWLGVSEQFLEIGRLQGYGPPFVRIAPKMIRYRRVDLVKWLGERVHKRTSEYTPRRRSAR